VIHTKTRKKSKTLPNNAKK